MTLPLLFILAGLPIVFVLLTWVMVTSYRIYRPESPLPLQEDPVVLRRESASAGELVPVGVREIREDQRRFLQHRSHIRYYYSPGTSCGVPSVWFDELWDRRN